MERSISMFLPLALLSKLLSLMSTLYGGVWGYPGVGIDKVDINACSTVRKRLKISSNFFKISGFILAIWVH